jgi:hypothetical protein
MLAIIKVIHILFQDSLNNYYSVTTMTSIVQDIQAIRSLRKELPVEKDLNLTPALLKSVELIHNCIKGGTDLGGWKKVDWRGGPSKGSNYGSSNGGYNYRNGSNSVAGGGNGRNNDGVKGNDSGNNSFFNNRRHPERSDNPSHSAFGNRGKSGFNGRQSSDQPVSIPLTNCVNSTNNTSTTNETNKVVTPTDGFRTVPQKYVSKFKKSTDGVEDTILNTILLGKLNKFSELNYSEIKEFITHIIDSGQTDMMKCFMKLVFEKAASEEVFCPLYAKLLSELSTQYPVLLTEMANLYSVYMQIFEEVPENKAENYNEVCKQNVEKKYRRGYSQFLAELIKHDVIDKDVFIRTINTIICQIETNSKVKDAVKLNEEYADCMMKIMNAIQGEPESESETDTDSDSEDIKEHPVITIRDTLKGDIYTRIQPLTIRNAEYIGVSTKTRFTLLDIYENIQKF